MREGSGTPRNALYFFAGEILGRPPTQLKKVKCRGVPDPSPTNPSKPTPALVRQRVNRDDQELPAVAFFDP
jgi:hypothetical protein